MHFQNLSRIIVYKLKNRLLKSGKVTHQALRYHSRAKVISTPAEIEITYGRNEYHFPPKSHPHSLIRQFSDAHRWFYVAQITSPDLDTRYFHHPNPTSCLTQTVFLGPNLDKNHIFLFRWPLFFIFSLCFPNLFPALLQKNRGFIPNPPSPDAKIPCFSPAHHHVAPLFFVFFQRNDDFPKKIQENSSMPKISKIAMRES